MIPLIILTNSLVCIFIGVLLYLYVHDFKPTLTRNRIILYFVFGACFMFNGFLRLKLGVSGYDIDDFDVYNHEHLFTILDLMTNTIIGIFIYNSIKSKRKRDASSNSNKND